MSYWEHPILQVKMVMHDATEAMTEMEVIKYKMAEWRDKHEHLLPEWTKESISRALYYADDESHIPVMRDLIRDAIEEMQ